MRGRWGVWILCSGLALSQTAPGWATGPTPLVFDERNWPPREAESGAPLSGMASLDSTPEAVAEEDWTRITKKALRGDPDAAYRLGRAFEEKTGQRATKRALQWLGQAAKAGHADAMFHLSRVHDRLVNERDASGGELREGIDADRREAVIWLRKARQSGSLDAFAWACGTAFDDEAPQALRGDARADCYLGFRLSEEGSRSRAWFRSKLEALPGWPRFGSELDFRARLIRHAHLIPGDEALLETRIIPRATSAGTSPRHVLVPFAVGHTWTFETDRGEEVVERVTDRYESDGPDWFRVETQTRSKALGAAPRIARVDDKGLHETGGVDDAGQHEADPAIEAVDTGDPTRSAFRFPTRSSLVFPYPAGVGSEVVIEIGPNTYEVVRMESEDLTVQTPAGRFDCVRYVVEQIDLDVAPPRSRATLVDFAPGVGMVQRQQSGGGPTITLTGYDLSRDMPAALP